MNYSGRKNLDAQKVSADEQIISNMIAVLNNPNISQHFNEEELNQICQAVKNHINIMAAEVLRVQEYNLKYSESEYGKIR